MRTLLGIFGLSIFMLSGCTREIGTVVLPEPAAGGSFAVTWSASAGGSIDLGQIRNTARFPLVVSNTGDREITGITITNSNPQFLADSSIDTLRPGDAFGSARIITLVAVHGTNPSGVGLAQTMAQGVNFDTLQLAGLTRDANGERHVVMMSTALRVTALLADIRLFDDTAEIDLTRPTGIETGFGVGINEILVYTVTHLMAKVVNSGNVPIYLTEYQGVNVLPERVILPNGVDSLSHLSTAVLDTRGTITIGNRLHISDDGRCYFQLSP
ncbi:MAG TPA: hypothetical protein VLY03_00165 [Bacteroidota bacterium]|nr:hypothetical protein [Bacteroidota bacterium]